MTLSANLDTLETSGLIRLLGAAPELEYFFRHALVQEATYHTLLRQDRRQLHRVVGDALERLYPQRGPELAAILARHFAEAGEHARALRYYVAAGEHAAQRYANAEAAMHYGRAIEILTEDGGRKTEDGVDAGRHGERRTTLSRQGGTTDSVESHSADLDPLLPSSASRPPSVLPSLVELYTKRGRALELSGQYAEAFATYQVMRGGAQRRGDHALELAALVLLAQTRSTPNPFYDAGEGAALTDEALRWARELGDRRAEAKLLWNQVNLAVFSGQMEQGLEYGEQAMELSRELGLREQLAYILNDIWRAYLTVGQWERALGVVVEASALWRELNNLPMLTDSLSTTAEVYLFGGQYDEALRASDEALRISHAIGNVWGESYSQFAIGRIYWDRGEPQRAIHTMEESIRLSIVAGFISPQTFTRAELALIVGTLGDVPRGIALAEQAAQLAKGQFPAFYPQPLAVLAMLRLMQGAQADAEAALREALGALESQNALVRPTVHLAEISVALGRGDWPQALRAADEFIDYLSLLQLRHLRADAFYLKGRALLAMGRLSYARYALDEAQREAERLGARRIEWQILTALAELAEQTERSAEAAELRGQAEAMRAPFLRGVE